jgi:hypothetical protein
VWPLAEMQAVNEILLKNSEKRPVENKTEICYRCITCLQWMEDKRRYKMLRITTVVNNIQT